MPSIDSEVRFDELFDNEIRWIDRQRFLQSKGYMLRPRLRPGWSPSWLENGKNPLKCEDSLCLSVKIHLVDATRISDGKLVCIKRVKTGDRESAIASLLYSEPYRQDSRNHSVPILDTFVDSEDPSISYIVMPFLREADWPDFENVAEVVDFVDQLLEGLVFMHEMGVAHRDCTMENVLMDASAMYPRSFHPIKCNHLPDGFTLATEIPRTEAGVRYHFIDYGISSYFPPGQPRALVTGRSGLDQDVPELSDTVPYEPFAVDIFIVGNTLRKEFEAKFSNVGFLKLIIQNATQRDPSRRPSASELLRTWTSQRRRISHLQRSWRLHSREESVVGIVARDCFSMVGSVFSFASSFMHRNWPGA